MHCAARMLHSIAWQHAACLLGQLLPRATQCGMLVQHHVVGLLLLYATDKVAHQDSMGSMYHRG